MARTKVLYEWCAEEVNEDADVVSCHFYDTRKLAEAHVRMDPNDRSITHVLVSLIRYEADRHGDMQDRQYAYLKDGKLPAEFDGGATVPAKYRT